MVEIRYDTERCAKCGLCTVACPHGILQQETRGTVPTVHDIGSCMECGHCVAVCPKVAISHSTYPEGSVMPTQPELAPSYEQVMELVHTRRSKRRFTDEPVTRSVIEQIIEAARHAPSEHNVQDTEFVVVQDQETIDQIAQATLAYYRRLSGMLRNPIGRAMFRLMSGARETEAVIEFLPEMEGVVSQYELGNDYVLNRAPVLILACADSVGGFPAVNANLGLAQAMLAAETLGIGTFYAGFVTRACGRGHEIARLVGLPDTHRIYGILAVGNPRVRYRRWPARNPARVTWIGEA